MINSANIALQKIDMHGFSIKQPFISHYFSFWSWPNCLSSKKRFRNPATNLQIHLHLAVR